MHTQEFNHLLTIISTTEDTHASFHTLSSDSISTVSQVVIHKCSTALITKLIKEGYKLSMNESGLCVHE